MADEGAVVDDPLTDTVFADLDDVSGPEWWSTYVSSLGGLTSTAREVLEADCRYIITQGVFGAGDPDPQRWPAVRVRRGLVMGSVQSGKTASMLGVSAMALDKQVDIVVILAGTRVSLWQQTLERLQSQLDPGPDSSAKRRRRILLPTASPAVNCLLSRRYASSRVQVARSLDRHQPIIVTAMKHKDHLREVRRTLAKSVFPAVEQSGRPVHMLVIDDESDDGSILDAAVEAGLDERTANLKQIPRAIADLWCPPSPETPPNFFATYVGYTATPQANFLQDEHNPLFPSDFLVALRTPLDRGQVMPRTTTYTEPRGLARFYMGGEVYYRRSPEAHLCVPTTGAADDLGTAIRAFLVASAVRLHRTPQRFGPAAASKATFSSRQDVLDRAPDPASMLVHRSAVKGEHFVTAEDVLLWAGAQNPEQARQILSAGGRLPAELAARIDQEEPLWERWRDAYHGSAQAVHRAFSTVAPAVVPDWSTIKKILVEEVIAGTRVSVVNSDPNADDRPEYAPVDMGDDNWSAGRDLSTIFVAGNVMSRGLTLEGLTTTLFQRTSDRPLVDSQMQMQRWFGYRGSYIDVCRVFAPDDQLEFFTHYHEQDEALRTVVLDAMNRRSDAATPVVLHGENFTATGKITNLGTKPLHPGRKPFIALVNAGTAPDPNAQLVRDLFAGADVEDVAAGGHVYGRILRAPLTLTAAADVLDRLQYDQYRPGNDNWQSQLWEQLQIRVDAVQPLPPGQPLYRPTQPHAGNAPAPVRADCPYSISAYLRLWDACLTRSVRGLFVTGQRNASWAVMDLRRMQLAQPRFWVGVRFGSGAPATGVLAPLSIPTTRKAVAGGRVDGTWGANNPLAGSGQFRGDEYFDYFHRREAPPVVPGGEPWRPAGADGQILFYVNQLAEQPYPSVAVGVCVPLGGPDQFAAYVQPR